MLRVSRAESGTFAAALSAARMVREASPRLSTAVLAMQVVTSAVVVLELVVVREVIARLTDLDGTAGMDMVLLPLVGFGLLTALRSTGESAGREMQWAVAERTERKVVTGILEVAATVPYQQLEDSAFRDRLARAMGAARKEVWDVAYGTLSVVQATLTTIGLVAFLATVAPVLLPAFVVAGFVVLNLGRRMGRARYRFEHHDTPADRERRYLAEALTSRGEGKEIRIFGSAAVLLKRHHALFDLRIDALDRLVRQRLRTALLGNLALAVVLVGSLAAVAWLTVRGQLDVADAAVTALTAQQLSQRLRGLVSAATAVHDSAIFLADVPSFLEDARSGPEQTSTQAVPDDVATVQLTGVCFRYPGATTPAVDHVDLTLSRGHVVALVGENGSGKSTLAKLICGLYRPSTGRVTMVGAHGETVDMADVTGGRSAMFQDFARYEITARDNVSLSDIDRGEDHDGVRRALRRATAEAFVDGLPEGLDTRLGRRFAGGVDLSGGQWQRLSLARSYFREAPLLVLDEPTASLDPQAEVALLRDLGRHEGRAAVLLISHRYSTVRHADRILVMNAGRIVEDGDHDTLMADGGLYAEFVRLQS